LISNQKPYAQLPLPTTPITPPLTTKMKTDNYLTLCLEQAAKSPLYYRHGCIIVRGGKVIGQGHNDYRPGFDGGALKHGRVAGSALSSDALAEMKAKLKERKGNKSKSKDQQQQQEQAAMEKIGAGGGAQANTPLSMHSEMMAIHSALSTSSNLACSSFSREKPCFKLPRGDKKKERLRRDVLQNYVERICTSTASTAGQAGKLQVQQCRFVHAASQCRGGTGSQRQQQRPPRGSGSAAAGRGGSGLSGSEGYGETPGSVREEERETARVRAVRVSQRPFWESGTARFWTETPTTETTTAICV
jgi:deoxycytidylate deaminase